MTNKNIDFYTKQDADNKIYSTPAILSIIIFTKEFYSSNNELHNFTEKYLNKSYKDYLFKSRTLLYSRIIKDFYINSNDTNFLIKAIDSLLSEKNNKKKGDRKKKNNKKDSQINIINKWRRVIDND